MKYWFAASPSQKDGHLWLFHSALSCPTLKEPEEAEGYQVLQFFLSYEFSVSSEWIVVSHQSHCWHHCNFHLSQVSLLKLLFHFLWWISWPNTPYLSAFLLSLSFPSLFMHPISSELFHLCPWYSFPVSCLSSRVPHSSSLDLFWTGRPQSLRLISCCAHAPVFMLTDIVLIFPPPCFPVQLIPVLYPNTLSLSAQGCNSPIFWWQQFYLMQTLELLFSAHFLASSYSNSSPSLHSHHRSWCVWGTILVGVERQNSCSQKLHRENIFLPALPLNRQNREELDVNHQQGFAD